MSHKLTDFSPAALVRANRANLYEFFRSFEQSPYMEFAKGDGLSRWSCTFQYAWFNAILGARDATPADSAYIEDSLAYFKAKNTTEITCWLEDGVNLASWETLLTPRGFRLEDGPAGMSVDLNRLNETGQIPAGAEIVAVSNEQSVRDCAEVLIYGYGFPPDWKDITIDFLIGLGQDTPYRSYVAYWEGKPVSTAAVFFGEEVAGIYSVATVAEARGKGFGAAVTLAPLLDARKMGYRVGILQASTMGLPVYKRMGFQQDFRVGSFFYTF
ncbi:MAG: GNAT family N-acetyltransferase [Chloroflexi bacterium]|nr:GNAT family N-acetyltransferase [Chloroflexota bacterium]